jgi:hypothetical protein
MPTPEQTLQDPEFNKLPIEDRRGILSRVDPEFGKLSSSDQSAVLSRAESNWRRIAGPGAVGSAWQALNPLPMMTEVFRHLQERPGMAEALFGPVPVALAKTLIPPQLEQFRKAGQQIGATARGETSPFAGTTGALMYGSAGMLPGYGPAITRAVEQERAGNPLGGLGTLAGTAAIPAVGEGFARVAGRISGKPIYESVVRPSTKLSPEARAAVVERGRATQTPASFAGKAAAKARGEVAGERVGELTSPLAETGQRTILNSEVLAPLDAEITKRRASNTPKSALPLEALRQEWIEQHGDEHAFITATQAQVLKEASDSLAKESTYAQYAKPAGEELGGKLLAQGERAGIARVIPEVQEPNRARYLDINLEKAINTALKRDPQWMDHFGRYILSRELVAGTAGLVGGVAMGHPMAGLSALGAGAGTAAITLLVRRAVQNPETMSRLSFALDQAGVKLPPRVRAAALIAPAMTTGAATRQPKLPDLPLTQLERK